MQTKSIFSHRPYWAHRLLPAAQLPMTRQEMDDLGWDSCDVILVTGDAYVDHPSFGMALIGRLLEAQGFRVGIIAQPAWQDSAPFMTLGRPNLYFGITAGNMDSMVNRYTSDRRIRSDDAYSPDGAGGLRPDRSTLVYSQRCREAYGDVPIVVGGIEASLRRIAHYDYWSDKVRRSVLFDTKADLLLFGNAERAIVELTHRLADGEPIHTIRDLRGSAFVQKRTPDGWYELDSSEIDEPGSQPVERHSGPDPYQERPDCEQAVTVVKQMREVPRDQRDRVVVRLPSYEQVRDDPTLYAHASRVFHLETNPGNARPLIQRCGNRQLWLNPPPLPLSTKELDRVYELPYTRQPHASYGTARLPAYEMIRFSINIMRGCFGGCTFCSITEHEGRIIQNRSEGSIVREVETLRDSVPGFTGNISDLGGPTANMYRLQCDDPKVESACRRLSCVFPDICTHMQTDHTPLIRLYRRVRELRGIKRVFIASGLRYDLALRSPDYIRELVTHHVGGYLKIAPEHTDPETLGLMMKPGMAVYHRFKELFDKFSQEAGKEQFLIPYFISAHPGSTIEAMLEMALWLKQNGLRLDQVQNFLPAPLAIASAMYHSGKNPLKPVHRGGESLYIPTGDRMRRLQKAFLRYHDANNWPLLREALKKMGRADLIGNGKRHLVPNWQPDSSDTALSRGRGGARPGGATPPRSGRASDKPSTKGIVKSRRGGATKATKGRPPTPPTKGRR